MVEKYFQREATPEEVEGTHNDHQKEIVAMRLNMDIAKLKGTIENLVKEITKDNHSNIMSLIAEYKQELLYRYAMFKAIVKPRTDEEHQEMLTEIKNNEFKLI